jgi:non-ribosomal peptide synthetase component F
VLGGEATPLAFARELRERAPGCAVFNHYGPTETTVGVMTFRYDPARALDSTSALPPARPVANARIYLLDERLEPVPVGMCGELYVGGAPVARGYLNRPELTARAFLPDPFSPTPGDRMYRTGAQELRAARILRLVQWRRRLRVQ